ncbi:Dinitrogenase iron-molybdenum cofactor biosynthesis protein [Methanohalobium evestigatum Z-7303]|uniref:Dinitrogenase iron-molybdenum cofactor biosynthesis protein n=1 Tax=Methanohalobium evestigatum (strain ATCC BAA-1072 / DSM 3721 / NBRC 107634 / OCM 161 / Z-7303) TaxID=644295 RepID=D7EBT3_METEZ|nr:NifB/NifX family molybdenum-iron cluster-binding protein [Methanohalobium evestigatum]ADI74925.1 Dinitrogenase iron-molybdenum cofactor biosynthesis protein [Methanohalobium evestigatum Z-7303]
MKVCIPSNDNGCFEASICEHFGRASYYTLVDTDTNTVEVLPNIGEHMGGTRKPPEILSESGVEVMLCSGIGPGAINMFENYCIDVYVGAKGTVKDALKLWNTGNLEEATKENACKSHQH